MEKSAFITGALGMDGSYLSELLLDKGYKVYGLYRRAANINTKNIESILDHTNFSLLCCDITDAHSVSGLVNEYKPDEFYNLAAMSFVGASFTQPNLSINVNTIGVINCLEAIKNCSKDTRFYQASTSEQFGSNVSWEYDIQGCCARYDGPLDSTISAYTERYGHVCSSPCNEYDGIFQDELTPFAPRSQYGISKVAAHLSVGLYRDMYKLHASTGILYNHEGKRRGKEFFTRKVTDYIGRLMKVVLEHGKPTGHSATHLFFPSFEFPKLQLGNCAFFRDWGHSQDYVTAMWLMLQQDKSDDYVVATGQTRTGHNFLNEAFAIVNLDYKDYIYINPDLYRPAEVDYLCGKADKARSVLGWQPTIRFGELVKEMVENDIQQNQ